jgi:hypothetical protein
MLFVLSASVNAQQGAKTSPAGLTPNEQTAAAQLESKTIRETTMILASKEMEGRAVGQPGADRAAKYIADQFAKLGLKAGGDAGTYLQAVKFIVDQPSPESSFKAGDTTFRYMEDFRLPPVGPGEPKDVTGSLVFAGYGVVSEELNRNDLKGIDVNGKVVMVLNGKPRNLAKDLWEKHLTGPPVGELAKNGAKCVLIVWDDIFTTVGDHPNRNRIVSLAEAPAPVSGYPPIIIINTRTAEKLFAGQNITFSKARQLAEAGEHVSRDLNLPVRVLDRHKREEKINGNVLAVLEGADPKLKDQAVIISAHYDAFGIGADGSIYPGAADNALGVGKLIAIAEALKKSKTRLRRSVIFFASVGEENGLLGAKYWTNHPTWPIEKVAANINYDGFGTDAWGPLGLIVNYNYDHSDLGDLIKEVAVANSVEIIPDPLPKQYAFYRSDHYVFSLKGVPSLLLIGAPKPENMTEFIKRVHDWRKAHYHTTEDTVKTSWDWEGPKSLTALGMITAIRIANQDQLPAWKTDSPYNRPRGNNLPPPPTP